MTLEVSLMLGLLAGGLALFALEILPIEVTAFLMLAALLVSGAITDPCRKSSSAEREG